MELLQNFVLALTSYSHFWVTWKKTPWLLALLLSREHYLIVLPFSLDPLLFLSFISKASAHILRSIFCNLKASSILILLIYFFIINSFWFLSYFVLLSVQIPLTLPRAKGQEGPLRRAETRGERTGSISSQQQLWPAQGAFEIQVNAAADVISLWWQVELLLHIQRKTENVYYTCLGWM